MSTQKSRPGGGGSGSGGQERQVSITAIVDCVGSLATGTLLGNLYLYDTNKAGGSSGLGTGELTTKVKKGDQLVWTALALTRETYVCIHGIDIDGEVCVPERKVFPETDVSYWVGTVKKDVEQFVPYQLQFKVGRKDEPMTSPLSPGLAGQDVATAGTAASQEER
ncbi:hypothetical protein ACGFNU_32845 [Spirillospora sp. NPDC048911]|uniref:hypothetical protein n=1 Tax=Spirillospora sp. NPDC048911 TaxID=3364527 RepID=UPI00371438DC